MAYPVHNPPQQERLAEVRFDYEAWNTDRAEHVHYERWRWRVVWTDWFVEHSWADSKQAAADEATAAWWRNVDTELPRDVKLEAAIIAARTPVRPPPNSLMVDDVELLQSVLWNLTSTHHAALKDGTTPAAVSDLITRISEELQRRRDAGEIVEAPKRPDVMHHRRRRR